MPPTHQDHDLTPGHVGPDGKVRYWDIPAAAWKRAASADVREYMAKGTGSMHGPDVELSKGSETKVVCAVEVEALEADGWKRSGKGKDVPNPPVAPKGKQAPKDEDEGEGDPAANPAPYNFGQHKMPELIQFATEASIDYDGLTKAQLIEALDKANYRPSTKS